MNVHQYDKCATVITFPKNKIHLKCMWYVVIKDVKYCLLSSLNCEARSLNKQEMCGEVHGHPIALCCDCSWLHPLDTFVCVFANCAFRQHLSCWPDSTIYVSFSFEAAFCAPPVPVWPRTVHYCVLVSLNSFVCSVFRTSSNRMKSHSRPHRPFAVALRHYCQPLKEIWGSAHYIQ